MIFNLYRRPLNCNTRATAAPQNAAAAFKLIGPPIEPNAGFTREVACCRRPSEIVPMTPDRLPVLMYHRLGESHNQWERKYCVAPTLFAQQMQALAGNGWQAISLDTFIAWLEGREKIPERAFLLTFDDGFLGVFEHAAPVLAALNWPATVFLVSSLIGRRDEWCAAENPGGATYPLMDAPHIRELTSQGFRFESHTRSHASLPKLDDATLKNELIGARTELSDLLGRSVNYLAYPFGHLDDRVVEAAQAAGYQAAFSTRPGFNRAGEDRYRLRRLDVFGSDSASALLRKIRLGSNDGSLRNSIHYGTSRILARLGLLGG